MYIALLFLLLAVSAFILFKGIKTKTISLAVLGGALAVITIVFFSILDLWGEILWFQQIGYGERIWTELLAKVGFAAAAAFIGWGLLFIFTLSLPGENRLLRWFSRGAGAVIGALWGFSNWLVILKFMNRVSTGVADPVLGQDAGFYMFVLPFLVSFYRFILLILFLSLATLLGALFVRLNENSMQVEVRSFSVEVRKKMVNWLYVNAAAILFMLAAGKFLNRYELLYSTWCGYRAGLDRCQYPASGIYCIYYFNCCVGSDRTFTLSEAADAPDCF
ncbi:MAG: UPF0182 family protein [candidate division KSB1 bacterium]|nr:UPF0182 family protein [candidate division KSB1 bacterium]